MRGQRGGTTLAPKSGRGGLDQGLMTDLGGGDTIPVRKSPRGEGIQGPGLLMRGGRGTLVLTEEIRGGLLIEETGGEKLLRGRADVKRNPRGEGMILALRTRGGKGGGNMSRHDEV